jgi:endonuclease YncB( thermonuclease family)
MVKRGWALAYRKYSKDYVNDEEEAKEKKIGLWAGEFIPPWEWRRLKR